MPTYTWSIPTGKEITGATYIKDTDNNISDTIDDLVDFVNGTGVHAGQGLTYDLIDNSSAQTIAGVKTVGTGGAVDFTDGELRIGSTAITSTAAELNLLDGVTSTTAELNILDGVTATTEEINVLDGYLGSVTELNYLKTLYDTGVTDTEFDVLDGLTATTAELNIMDGVTATTVELNYISGVTSAIQTQMDAKAPLASPALTGTPTAPTATTGTSTTQVATTAFVQQEISSSLWTYESADITVPTSGGKTESAHSLGFVPTDYQVVMKCTVADDGYEVGDEIQLSTEINSSGRTTVWANATNVGISATAAGQFTSRTNRETGAVCSFTSTSWKLVFRAK